MTYSMTRHHMDYSAPEVFESDDLSDALAYADLTITYTGVWYAEIHNDEGIDIASRTPKMVIPFVGLPQCGA